MALDPEVQALLEALIRKWAVGLLTEIEATGQRVVADLVSTPKKPEWERLAPTGLLHTRAASCYLALSVSTLEKLRVTGGGPPYVKLRRGVRYRAEVLERWIAEREFPNTSAADRGLSRAPKRGRRRRS